MINVIKEIKDFINSEEYSENGRKIILKEHLVDVNIKNSFIIPQLESDNIEKNLQFEYEGYYVFVNLLNELAFIIKKDNVSNMDINTFSNIEIVKLNTSILTTLEEIADEETDDLMRVANTVDLLYSNVGNIDSFKLLLTAEYPHYIYDRVLNLLFESGTLETNDNSISNAVFSFKFKNGDVICVNAKKDIVYDIDFKDREHPIDKEYSEFLICWFKGRILSNMDT